MTAAPVPGSILDPLGSGHYAELDSQYTPFINTLERVLVFSGQNGRLSERNQGVSERQAWDRCYRYTTPGGRAVSPSELKKSGNPSKPPAGVSLLTGMTSSS
ncbi:hypothetical protein AAFF_G00250560 [Aldrovandia affinis]|uniref:Uncharacterized protein n=1 Tax=Aldrovandia affinis TaxID=143900 RepID=A0AAD7RD57_9TELE|nr:hypothetical protein AAFF_G00250560 [Aldrovandia affinis]